MATGLTQNVLAAALGLSKGRLSQLKAEGMPVDSIEAAQAWRAERQNIAARKSLPDQVAAALQSIAPQSTFPALPAMRRPDPGAPPQGGATDICDELEEDRDRARTRREISEANIAEMTEARMRRDLIRVTAVQAQLATEYATLRDALLQIPARMAPTLAAESDPAAIQTALHAEIHHALTDLAGAADRVPDIDGAFE